MAQKVKYEGGKKTIEGEEVSPFASTCDPKEVVKIQKKIIAMNQGNTFGKEKPIELPKETNKEKPKEKIK